MIKFTKSQIKKTRETRAWFANHMKDNNIDARGLYLNGKPVEIHLVELKDGKNTKIIAVLPKVLKNTDHLLYNFVLVKTSSIELREPKKKAKIFSVLGEARELLNTKRTTIVHRTTFSTTKDTLGRFIDVDLNHTPQTFVVTNTPDLTVYEGKMTKL